MWGNGDEGSVDFFVWVMWNDTYCLRVSRLPFPRKLSPDCPRYYQPEKDNIFRTRKGGQTLKGRAGFAVSVEMAGKGFFRPLCGAVVSRLFPLFLSPFSPFPLPRERKKRVYIERKMPAFLFGGKCGQKIFFGK